METDLKDLNALIKAVEKQDRAIEYIYERLHALEECRMRMALKHKEAYETSFDKDFTSKGYAPFFFPILNTNSGEAEYCVKQILNLYSSKRIKLRTSSINQYEKWSNVIEDAFN